MSYFIYYVTLFVIIWITACAAQESPRNPFIVFGDSYTAEHTDPCNGPKWIRELENTWNNLSISNFAVGGACCYKNDDGPSPPITRQIDSYFEQEPVNDPDSSIYAIFVGINDLVQNEAYNDIVVCIQGQTTRLIEQAHGKQFLIFNMVPFDHSPRIRIENITEYAAEWIEKFNLELNTTISSMQRQYPNTTIVLIDTHTTFLNILNHPTDYGITQGVIDYYTHVHPDPGSDPGKLLTTGNQYFWFDQSHITSGVHDQIHKAIVAQQPFPYLPLMDPNSPSPPPHSIASSPLRDYHCNYALVAFFIALVSIL
ncbi:hypothetical protein BDA99DRAFT_500561 [Phascolomyces articulosus]|uniref:SGNH hydrolase-type esterase domain-containing protein n=1 Tax=Phascolomyces articulosus TaxID=60185 RepID=A0AAD5K6E2_9FUNG|nr:hypothetical protein BDA99DRAFT_500561 [Phascolomyces articulosus]